MRRATSIVFGASLVVGATAASTARAQDLQPPPAAPAQPQPGAPQNATDADLRQSEKEDSGLGLEWIYLNAGGGLSNINLKSFSESSLALETTSKTGGMYTFGAGVRLLFLTLGLRATNHTAWNLWQLNADVGLHMKIARVDGYLAIRGGYDTVGTLSQSVSLASSGGNATSANVDVHGWNAGAAIGLDYYFTSLISLGAEVSGDILFISRPAPALPNASSLPGTPDQQQQALIQIKASPLYAESGSSVGFGAAGSLHLGVHF